ncbi:MAG TPA: ParB N-terminal domain-containing protein [Paraburkholderia sp.]|uniref:ParB N-terminal domain-containing protein n=1 Tax=Paraburkholderia sp. TaxID=1926495 RepID=UPI002ED57189
MHPDWPIRLISTELILPNEHHIEARLLEVIASISGSGRWTTPIVLEQRSLAVMDGHHRLAAAKRLELSRVPCVMLDYAQVTVEARRIGYCVDGEEIVKRARTRMLYPPKTTRHIFADTLPDCDVDLSILRAAI